MGDLHLPQTLEALRSSVEAARVAYVEALPENWRELEPDQLERMVDFIEETGWCLVGPRREIVVELLAAEHSMCRCRTSAWYSRYFFRHSFATSSEVHEDRFSGSRAIGFIASLPPNDESSPRVRRLDPR